MSHENILSVSRGTRRQANATVDNAAPQTPDDNTQRPHTLPPPLKPTAFKRPYPNYQLPTPHTYPDRQPTTNSPPIPTKMLLRLFLKRCFLV